MKRILTATVLLLTACGTPAPRAVPLPPPPVVEPVELPGIQIMASEVPDPDADGPIITSHGEIRPTTTTSTVTTSTTTTVPHERQATNTTTTTAPSSPPAPTTTTTLPAPAPSPQVEVDPAAEAQFLSLVNGLRSSRGIAPLSMDGTLRSYARSWSTRMATTGTFAHSNISSLLGPWSAVAENIATGVGVAPLFDALVASPGHLENMLNPAYTSTGVGIVVDADGVVWITQEFAG